MVIVRAPVAGMIARERRNLVAVLSRRHRPPVGGLGSEVSSWPVTAASPWSQQEHQPNTGWPDASYGDSHKGGDGFFSVEVHRSSQSNDPPTW